MARNIAIRKLARRLGRTPEDLVQALSAMGHTRYASVDGVLPGELADRVAAQLHRAKTTPPPDDFDALMRAQGVTRLGEAPAGRAPARPDRPAPKRKAATRAPSAPKARQARPQRSQQAANPEYARELEQVLSGAREKLKSLEQQLHDVRDARTAEAEQGAGRIRELEQLLAAEHRARLGAVARAEKAEGTLAARLAEDAATPCVRELLAERGLMGEDEEAEALIAVLRSHRLGVLDACIAPTDLTRLRTLLSDRVVLHCGRDACPVPAGTAVVVVAEARCEVCSGSDMTRAFAQASEALMLNGFRRVTIVGGSLGYHRHLRHGLDDRVELKLVEGTRKRTARQAKRDMADSQLVVIWGGSLPREEVERLYGDPEVRLLVVDHRGMGAMLREVAEALA